MKRVAVVALSVALFTTLIGGLASADSANRDHAQADVVVDTVTDHHVRSLLERCRRILGEDQLTDISYERCLELWKRWCNAHPRSHRCPQPKPPPHPCKVLFDRSSDVRAGDAVIDRCCLLDRVAEIRPCPPPPPPPPPCTDVVTDRCCKIDRVTDLRHCPEPPPPPPPCTVTDVITDRCCVVDRVADVHPCPPPPPPPPPCEVTDRATDLRCDPCMRTDVLAPCPVPTPTPIPVPKPIPLPDPCEIDGDIVKCVPVDPCLTDAAGLCVPPECDLTASLITCDPIPPKDRTTDQARDRLTDQEGNDVHLRTRDADS